MAKTLKDFLNEREQLGPMKVKNPDEQKFIDKHVTATVADRNGNDDELFKGSKVKMADRKKHRKGYDPGEDEEVYEEVEQIDELSKKALSRYIKKAEPDSDRLLDKGMEQGDSKSWKKGHQRLDNVNKAKDKWGADKRYIKVPATEETQIDELSQDKLSQYRSAASDPKYGKDQKKTMNRLKGYSLAGRKVNPGLSASMGKAPRVAATEEVELGEKLNMDKASMGDVIKDFQDSNAPQFKGKSDKKRRAMAIAAKLSAERGSRGYTKEERLQAKLNDLSESHKNTMLEVFEKLNDDNQMKFMAACDTPEGVEQMLDFAINHRGEEWQ